MKGFGNDLEHDAMNTVLIHGMCEGAQGEKRGSMEPVKLAVLGLNQGAKIVKDALKHDEVELVAVAGFGPQAESLANELGLKRYEDYRLLLRQEQLDAVAIALPNGLHVEAVDEALAAGARNILLEKPIANTVDEAEHIIAACEEADATLLVGHHRRSSPRYVFLRELIASGRLGKIVGLQSSFAIAKPFAYFDVEWRVKKGGGPLLINAVHDFDDLNYLTGMKPARVYAAARNDIRGNEVEDAVSVIVEYEGGATATYFVSDGTPGPWSYDLAAEENLNYGLCNDENSLRIFGTEGSFGFPHMDLYYYNKDHYGWNEPLVKEHFDYEINDPMAAELDHFVDLCQGRETKPRCTGEDALDTLRVIIGIQKSAEMKQAVDL